MSDNISVTAAGAVVYSIATTDIGSVHHQQVKMEYGGAGVATPVSLAAPLPVSLVDVSKGDGQALSTSSAALLSSLVTIPSGATKVDLRPTAEIRVRDNGSNPTATLGMRVLPDEYWTYRGSLLSQLRVINAATIECWFYA